MNWKNWCTDSFLSSYIQHFIGFIQSNTHHYGHMLCCDDWMSGISCHMYDHIPSFVVSNFTRFSLRFQTFHLYWWNQSLRRSIGHKQYRYWSQNQVWFIFDWSTFFFYTSLTAPLPWQSCSRIYNYFTSQHCLCTTWLHCPWVICMGMSTTLYPLVNVW